MRIHVMEDTGRRVNIMVPVTMFNPDTNEWTSYPHLNDPDLRKRLGIIEVDEPPPPEEYTRDPSLFDVFTLVYAPYTQYSRISDKVIAQRTTEKAKTDIAVLESKQHRAIREHVLNGDSTALQALDDKINVLRAIINAQKVIIEA
jgi:hypothetical protein